MTDPPVLTYLGLEFLFRNADDHSWIVTKTFTFKDDAAGDNQLLAALIAHDQYSVEFPFYEPTLRIWPNHGPYRTKAITPASYEEVSVDDAEAALALWVTKEPDPTTGREASRLQASRLPLRSARSCYRMKELGSGARMAGPFADIPDLLIDGAWEIEYVAIKPGTLILLVAGSD